MSDTLLKILKCAEYNIVYIFIYAYTYLYIYIYIYVYYIYINAYIYIYTNIFTYSPDILLGFAFLKSPISKMLPHKNLTMYLMR